MFEAFLPSHDVTILELGCGNSDLSVEMWHEGYKTITAIDHATTCIEASPSGHDCCNLTIRLEPSGAGTAGGISEPPWPHL